MFAIAALKSKCVFVQYADFLSRLKNKSHKPDIISVYIIAEVTAKPLTKRRTEMRSRIILSVIAACMLMLTGCSEDSSKTSDHDNEKYISGTGDVSQSSEKIMEKEYDNIKVSPDFYVDAAKDILPACYEITVMDDMQNNSDKIFEHYFGKEYDNTKVQDNSVAKIYESDDQIVLVKPNGTVGIWSHNKEDIELGTGLEYKNDVLLNSKTDQPYEMSGKKLETEKIKEISVSKLKEFTDLVGFPNEIKSFCVTTRTLDSGEEIAVVKLRKLFGGIPIFDLGDTGSQLPFKLPRIWPAIVCLNSDYEPITIQSYQGFTESKKVKETDRIISPEEAMDNASESLAEYLQLTALYEELVYMPTCTGSKNSASKMDGAEAGDILSIEPYWVIYFDLSWWKEKYAAVNAVTGEVYYVDNSRAV